MTHVSDVNCKYYSKEIHKKSSTVVYPKTTSQEERKEEKIEQLAMKLRID